MSWENNKWWKKLPLPELDLDVILPRRIGLMQTIIGRILAISRMGYRHTIEKYGKLNTGRYLRDIVSIIKTEIQQIIKSTTWYLLRKAIIVLCTISEKVLNESGHTWRPSDPLLQNGTEVSPDENGISIMLTESQEKGKTKENQESVLVSSAEKHFILGMSDKNTATRTAKREHSVYVVSSQPTKIKAEVYNLLIEDIPEYYAEGILVHNCDAMRYAIFSERGVPVQIFIQ